jgi:hypothetical protein
MRAQESHQHLLVAELLPLRVLSREVAAQVFAVTR